MIKFKSRWRERGKLKNAKDLADYDSKVYAAQKAMKNHMSKHLHSLGIPFFELSADKVHNVDGEAPNGKISEDKLLELQKKMIEYLETIYAPWTEVHDNEALNITSVLIVETTGMARRTLSRIFSKLQIRTYGGRNEFCLLVKLHKVLNVAE